MAGRTVGEVVRNLDQQFPGFRDQIVESDDLKSSLAVSVDGDWRWAGLLEQVRESSEIHFVPAIGGRLSDAAAGRSLTSCQKRAGSNRAYCSALEQRSSCSHPFDGRDMASTDVATILNALEMSHRQRGGAPAGCVSALARSTAIAPAGTAGRRGGRRHHHPLLRRFELALR